MCVQPLSVELGPGILENIFDGIQVCLLVFSVECDLEITRIEYFYAV
jgi:vacuolar-type H+-ATPase catalytic subunit A/Vma1